MRGLERLRFPLSLSAAGHTSVVVRREMVGTGLVRVPGVEFGNDFVCVSEVRGCRPLVFFVGAFITGPANVIK